MRQHTLESVCENLSRRAFGGDWRVEDAVLAIIALLLVVNGHATDAACMHALPASTALEAAAALDRGFLLEGATARRCGTLVQGRGPGRGSLGHVAVEDRRASCARVKVLLEPAHALVARGSWRVGVLVDAKVELRRAAIASAEM